MDPTLAVTSHHNLIKKYFRVLLTPVYTVDGPLNAPPFPSSRPRPPFLPQFTPIRCSPGSAVASQRRTMQLIATEVAHRPLTWTRKPRLTHETGYVDPSWPFSSPPPRRGLLTRPKSDPELSHIYITCLPNDYMTRYTTHHAIFQQTKTTLAPVPLPSATPSLPPLVMIHPPSASPPAPTPDDGIRPHGHRHPNG